MIKYDQDMEWPNASVKVMEWFNTRKEKHTEIYRNDNSVDVEYSESTPKSCILIWIIFFYKKYYVTLY